MPALKRMGRQVTKQATPGEQVLSRLLPYSAYATQWGGLRIEQVQHYLDWQFIAINTIASKAASITPNTAYVGDAPKPGVTVKACQRGFMNALGTGFGGSPEIDTGYQRSKHAPVTRRALPGGFGGGGGHTYMTVGEYRSKALSVIKPHEELEPLENGHLLRRIIDCPNAMDTAFDYAYEKVMFLYLCGTSYEWVIPNAFGRPCERWVIPSHWVWPRTGDNREVDEDHPDADRLVSHYEVRPFGVPGSAGMLRLPASEVVVTRFKSPISKLDGYSRLWAISRWIDTEESITKSRWAQFINKARPELWIELGPGYEDPDDNMMERLYAKVAQRHQGEFNTGKPLITPSGSKANILSFAPSEMDYVQSEEQMAGMILSTFGVPKAAVGLVNDMTFGSILATLMNLCESCINPLLSMMGQTDTKFLASRWDERAPAWSTTTGSGHGSGQSERRVKLWYDNCLDDKTECLTADGWKKHDELNENTKIACYDEKTNTLVYHAPINIINGHYKGNVHVWSGARIDAVMTPGHRAWVQTRPRPNRREPDWRFIPVQDLAVSQTYRIKRAACAACAIPEVIHINKYERSNEQHRPHVMVGTTPVDQDNWLKLLGYYISEGWLGRSRAPSDGAWITCIVQSPEDVCFSDLENCLNSSVATWNKRLQHNKKYNKDYAYFTSYDRGLYEHLLEHCGKGSVNKKVPSYIKEWPAESLMVLLDALIAGDGATPITNVNTGNTSTVYTTISPQLADDVMEIAIKCGFAATISSKEPVNPNHSKAYRINITTRVDVMVMPQDRSVEPYNGMIWCVEVPTGKFVVRRNGKAHITGNCTPADPAQVNSDITTDAGCWAIVPNEVRAMRGRAPYKIGGGNPLVQGPGGIMPLPINEEESMDDLGELVAQYTSQLAGDKDATKLATQQSNEDVPTEDDGASSGSDEMEDSLADMSDGGKVEDPNGKPSKQWRRKGWVTLESGTHVFIGSGGSVTAGPAALQGKPLPGHAPKHEVKPHPSDKPKQTSPTAHGESKSKAKVETIGNAEEAVKKVSGGKLTAKDMASLVGAPDDAKVTVSDSGKNGSPDGRVHMRIDGDGFNAVRQMGKDRDGQSYIYNDVFYVDEQKQGKGIAADVFSKQVQSAVAAKVGSIRCNAAGGPGDVQNGYYTWPRFGYDQSFEGEGGKAFGSRVLAKVKAKYPDAKSVQDVMATKEGRDWWKANGAEMTKAKFDLSEGSRSRKVLDAYMTERRASGRSKSWMKSVPSGQVDDAENIDVSSEQEAALEAAWDRLDGGAVDEPNGEPSKSLTAWYRKEASILKAPGQGTNFATTDEAIAHAVNTAERENRADFDARTNKSLAFDTVQAAGRWLANKWAQLEARYSRAGALAAAVAMVATSPLPGNVAAIVAIAEGIRFASRRKSKARIGVKSVLPVAERFKTNGHVKAAPPPKTEDERVAEYKRQLEAAL